MAEVRKINITPSPQVLLALTNTPLKPLDAVCELIDNGLDAFRSAKLAGVTITNPWIQINIPSGSEVSRGDGVIQIIDNGVGLDEETLEKALTAGFSSQNQFDSLGLFGMGFNIATGKLGMKTRVTSARAEDDYAIQTVINLPELVKAQSFDLDTIRVPKPSDLDSGTIIEISGWWPEGTQNAGFVKKLTDISKPKLAEQIGRRYASILRRSESERVSMRLNADPVRSFEHCVWNENRFVERQGWGRIPARIEFDEIVTSQKHCIRDRNLIMPASNECTQCGGTEFRTVDERIKGWVGIQRFDDQDFFGVDVIRNGRAILVGEKESFFFLKDELGSKLKEYPVDGIYGRIVGEIHLDHVPVDFTKQDFQRASESWQRAMDYVRGKSLLEGQWAAGYKNESPIGRLFKGYRKVRTFGLTDLYMGTYDEAQKKAVRISRSVEKDYYQRFLNREAGYFEDTEWFKLVEEASRPNVRGLTPCPDCGFQNGDNEEQCAECNLVIKAKDCISCSDVIVESAASCPSCGASQIPEVEEPWTCPVCKTVNNVEDQNCSKCNSLLGTKDPMDYGALVAKSEHSEDLSFSSKIFEISEGDWTQPLSVNTSNVVGERLYVRWGEPFVPMLVFKNKVGSIEIFIDLDHDLFSKFNVSPRSLVAFEAASYLIQLSGVASKSGSSSAVEVVYREVWGENSTSGLDSLLSGITDFFSQLATQVASLSSSRDFANDLTNAEQEDLARRLIQVNQLDNLPTLKENGAYLSFLQPTSIARLFTRSAEDWFGIVWAEALPAGSLGMEAVREAAQRRISLFQRALEDCASYVNHQTSDLNEINRVRSSLEFLQGKLI
jgi:hypothetical protein